MTAQDARHATQYPILNLGCGTSQDDDAWNVDAIPAVDPDEVVDLDEYPWPWPDETYQSIRASHVLEHLADMPGALEECARLLCPGGYLVAKLPMGVNAIADPDHTWGVDGRPGKPWTWQTPEFYCGKRHWDRNVGLEVETKHVDMHCHLNGVAGAWKRARWERQLRTHGPGEWCFSLSCMSGEFTVVFRKP